MGDHELAVYRIEVRTQVSMALNAAAALGMALARREQHDADGQQRLHQEVFRSIHSMLSHTSNVSRLLWPTPPRRKKRETKATYETRCPQVPRGLRVALGLPEDSHPLKTRRLRDLTLSISMNAWTIGAGGAHERTSCRT